MKLILSLLSICLCSIGAIGQQKMQKKIALVVGVSNYEHANPLKNTLNDAVDISIKLELLGFKVIKLLDAELKTISKVVDSVGKKLSQEDIFLFYFSGHGAEYNGENYLFFKNSNPVIPNDMPFETFPIGKLLGKIEYAAVKTSIILLDACRSNPFLKSWDRNGSVREGLTTIDAPTGTFIGYAASPGKTASDGVRRNGTYTEAILKFIELKNISIDQLFNKVNKEVRSQSNGKQIPYKNSSLEDDFYFIKDNNFPKEGDSDQLISQENFVVAPLNRPRFPMPKIMRGYRNEMINSFALTSINKTTFDKNEVIEISISLFGGIIWDKTTPLYVEIVKRNSPTSVVMIYGEQFQPSSRNTTLRISSALDAGDYEMTFGFYLVDELNQEYPPFYSRKYKITIL